MNSFPIRPAREAQTPQVIVWPKSTTHIILMPHARESLVLSSDREFATVAACIRVAVIHSAVCDRGGSVYAAPDESRISPATVRQVLHLGNFREYATLSRL